MANVRKIGDINNTLDINTGITIEPGNVDPLVSPTKAPIYEYAPEHQYLKGEFCLVKEGKKYVIYKANKDTGSVFKAADWDVYSLSDLHAEKFTEINNHFYDTDENVTILENRVDQVETDLRELSGTLTQDDEGLTKVTGLPSIDGIMYTNKFNPFVSLAERGITKFKGVVFSGTSVPLSTDMSIDLGDAPTSGLGHNLVYLEVHRVMSRTGVKVQSRLRTLMINDDERELSETKSTFLNPLTVTASKRIEPLNALGGKLSLDGGKTKDSTSYKYGTFLSINERSTSPNESQKTRLYDTDVFVAGDGTFASKELLGTVDGFAYAIPLYYVRRRNSYPYSLFNKDGGNLYVEAEATLIDTNLTPTSVFPITLLDGSNVSFNDGDVFFLGEPEDNVKVQYTGTKDQYSRPLFVFIDQVKPPVFTSKTQRLLSYAKYSHYYNIITSDDVKYVVKTELGSNSSYDEVLINEFNKLLRGDLKMTSREVIEYFGPNAYNLDGEININHLINGEDRFRTEWSNRPTYIEVTREISPVPSENDNVVSLTQEVTDTFTLGDKITFTSKNIISPPLNDALKLNSSKIISVTGTTITVSNTSLLAVDDIVNIVNPSTLEIVGKNIKVTERNGTLNTIKLSDSSFARVDYLILESSVTPYFIVSQNGTKASWLDINTRNPLATLMSPMSATTMVTETKTVDTFTDMGLDISEADAFKDYTSPNVSKFSMAMDSGYSTFIKNDGSLWVIRKDSVNDTFDPYRIGRDNDWSSACGMGGTLFAIKTDGTLWSLSHVSDNKYNGQGSSFVVGKLTQILNSGGKKWAKLCMGPNSIFVISTTGEMQSISSKSEIIGVDGTVGGNLFTIIPSDVPWKDVAMGEYHVAAIKTDGSLWTWGLNVDGKLGTGEDVSATSKTPVRVGSTNDWESVYCGMSHTLALKKDGTLWGWGSNKTLQLGLPSTVSIVNTPSKVNDDKNYLKVACGSFGTAIIKNDGNLYVFGDNIYGQAGNPYSTKSAYLEHVHEGKWVDVTMGGRSIMAMREDGTILAWGGNNIYGFLGTRDIYERDIPTIITIGSKSVIPLPGTKWGPQIQNVDGLVYGSGDNVYGQISSVERKYINELTLVSEDNDWVSFDINETHSAGVKKDGTLWAKGNIANSQIGEGRNGGMNMIGTDTDWLEVAIGYSFVAALKKDGTLWTWGNNTFGQLGNGTKTSLVTPTKVDVDAIMLHVYAGMYVTFAIDSLGNVWACGHNNGMYGNGTTEDSLTMIKVYSTNLPMAYISVGVSHVVGVKRSGDVCTWGSNGNGQLGNNSTVDSTSPVPVPNISKDEAWAYVSCAQSRHTIAVTTKGRLYSWGENYENGIPGRASKVVLKVPTKVSEDSDWVAASACYDATGAIKKDGSLWVCGHNYQGDLGLGYMTSVNKLTLQPSVSYKNRRNMSDWKVIKAGTNFTVGLKNDGTLWAWGNNENGQLGDGTTVNKSKPIQVTDHTDWVSVAVGKSTIIGIKSDGTMWGCGYNANKLLASSTTTNSYVMKQLGTDTDWKMVSIHSTHALAIKTNGTLWAWGSNNYGEFGNGSTSSTVSGTIVQIGTDTTWSYVSAGVSMSFGIKTDGTLWSWGINSQGSLGQSSTMNLSAPTKVGSATDWKFVQAGNNATIALKTDGSLWVTGINTYGQMGDGTTTRLTSFKRVAADTWLSVTLTDDSVFGVNKNGQFYGWGRNTNNIINPDANVTNVTTPKLIDARTNWDYVSGIGNTIVAMNNTTSYNVAGNNESGQFGNGTTAPSPTLVLVTGNKPVPPSRGKIVNISIGKNGAMAVVKSDGSVWYSGPSVGAIASLLPDAVNGVHSLTKLKGLPYATSVSLHSDNNLNILGYDNTRYVLGTSNAKGQLGLGSSGSTAVTVAKGDPSGYKYKKLTGNANMSIAITSYNTLLSWGSITGGMLGIDKTTDIITPTAVTNGGAWSDVSVGESFVVAVKTDGTVWVTGDATPFDLGQVNVFTQIPGLANATKVYAAKEFFIMDCLIGGEIERYYMGKNVLSDTGVNLAGTAPYPMTHDSESVAVSGKVVVRIKDSEVIVNGDNTNNKLAGGTGVSKISSGVRILTPATNKKYELMTNGDTTIVYNLEDQIIYGFGAVPNLGFNGSVYMKPRVVYSPSMVASGGNSTLIIKEDGSLWGMGSNDKGQLGLPYDVVNALTPTQIGEDKDWVHVSVGDGYSLAIKSDGSLWSTGDNTDGKLGDGSTLTRYGFEAVDTSHNFKYASAGSAHAGAITYKGELYLWGNGSNGRTGGLGTVNTPTKSTVEFKVAHVTCGESSTVAIAEDSTAYVTGANTKSILGRASATTLFTSIGSGYGKSEIRGGNQLLMNLMGLLYVCGANDKGQQGNGVVSSTAELVLERVTLPESFNNKNAIDIALGNKGTLVAILDDSSLIAWGDSYNGAVGNNTTLGNVPNIAVPTFPYSSFNAINVAVGDRHSIMMRAGDWNSFVTGLNGNGQLGIGTTNGRATYFKSNTISTKSFNPYVKYFPMTNGFIAYDPVIKEVYFTDYDKQSKMIVASVDIANYTLDNVYSAVKVQDNGLSLLLLDNDGTLFGSGLNTSGQLMSGTNSNIRPMAKVMENVRDFAIGKLFALVVKKDGTLWSAGSNTYGQLGNNTSASSITPVQIGAKTDWVAVAANEFKSYALNSKGEVYQWGLVKSKTLGETADVTVKVPELVTGLTDVVKISAGTSHVLALSSTGVVYTWGHNSSGQLMDGNIANNFTPTAVTMYGGLIAKDIIADGNSSVILTSNLDLYGSGDNSKGQLLIDNMPNIATPMTIYPVKNPLRTIKMCGGTFVIEGYDDLNNTNIGGNFNGGKSTTLGNLGFVKKISVTNYTNANNVRLSAILGDGSIWSMGSYAGNGTNTVGSGKMVQSGLDKDWKTVLCTINTTYAIKNDGTLWGWGNIIFKENNTANTLPSPTLVPTLLDSRKWKSIAADPTGTYVAAITESGELYGAGKNTRGQIAGKVAGNAYYNLTQLDSATDWAKVEIYDHMSYALKTTGILYVWGNIKVGENSTTTSYIPTAISTMKLVDFSVGSKFAVAWDSSGNLYTCGYNDGYNLGMGEDTESKTTMVPMNQGSDWSGVKVYHTLVLGVKKDGSLWKWGTDTNKVLSSDTTSNIPISVYSRDVLCLNFTPDKVALYEKGCIILTADNRMMQSGVRTEMDKLSVQSFIKSNMKPLKKMTFNKTVGYGIDYDGKLYGWGNGSGGYVGVKANVIYPKRLLSGESWVEVCVKYNNNSCYAIKSDGTLWCTNQNGILEMISGDTDWVELQSNIHSLCARKSDNSIYRASTNVNNEELTLIHGPMDIISWSCAYYGIVLVKSDGTLWGSSYSSISDILVGYHDKYPGVDVLVQLGADNDWLYVSGGSGSSGDTRHVIGIKSTGAIYIWGLFNENMGSDVSRYATLSPINLNDYNLFNYRTPPNIKKALLTRDHNLFIDVSNNVYLMNKSVKGPVLIAENVDDAYVTNNGVVIVKDGDMNIMSTDLSNGEMGTTQIEVEHSTQPITLNYRELLPASQGLVSTGSKNELAAVNGVEYHESNRMTLAIPLHYLKSTKSGVSTPLKEATAKEAGTISIFLDDILANVVPNSVYSVKNAVLYYGNESSVIDTVVNSGVLTATYNTSALYQKQVALYLDVEFDNSYAPQSGESMYVPKLLRVESTSADLVNDITQNILPPLTKYSPYGNLPVINMANGIGSVAGTGSITVTTVLDTRLVYQLVGGSTNTKVTVTSEDTTGAILTSNLNAEKTTLNFFKSTTDTVKGYKRVTLKFSAVDTTKVFTVSEDIGLYLCMQGKTKARVYSANMIDTVIDNVDHHFVSYNSSKVATKRPSAYVNNIITANNTTTGTATKSGVGFQLNMKNAVGDLTVKEINTQLSHITLDGTFSISDSSITFKMKVRDFNTNTWHEMVKFGTTYIIDATSNLSAKYVSQEGVVDIMLEFSTASTGLTVTGEIEAIRVYTKKSNMVLESRYVPVIYTNSNGDIRSIGNIFNSYGRASDLRFVREEVIKLEPVTDKEDIVNVYDSTDVLVTDVVSSNVGLSDHPFRNPLGLFSKLDTSNLVGVVGFKECEFDADSKHTNSMSKFSIVKGVLSGMASQDTSLTLSSPAVAMIKSLINTPEGLAMMITLVPTNGQIDTFDSKALRYIIPLNVYIPNDKLEVFTHETIKKKKW